MNKVFSFISALALACALLVLPASAVDWEPPQNDYVSDPATFLYQPIPVWTEGLNSNGTTTISKGWNYMALSTANSLTSGGWNKWYVVNTVEDRPVYAFRVGTSIKFATEVPSDSVWPKIYFAAQSDTGYVSTAYVTNFDFSSTSTNFVTSSTYSLKYFNATSTWTSCPDSSRFYANVPVFSTVNDGLAALRDFIDNPPPSSSITFTLPVGYVAVFQGFGSIELTSRFPRLSSPSPVNAVIDYAFGLTGQTSGSLSGYPADSTVFPLAGGNNLRWSAFGRTDLLGRTHNGIAHLIGSGYMYIYNPIYSANYVLEFGAGDINTYLNAPIAVSGFISGVRLYPLSASVAPGGIDGTLDDNDYVDVTVDPETEIPSYTDPEGDIVPAPAPGGNSTVPEESTNNSLLQTIINLLRNLVSEISGLFTFAFEAIVNLVSLAGGFFNVLAGIFGWLPDQVVTLIVSSLALIVTVGVLRSFL